ncbi:MAG: threonine-phosphate decarboxylase [Leptolyngbyaceae cyanobacterium SL_7_1]|nr:threonine-phosphate decarboxylase [Leptolyngbyaceae cyanobacterium SL_7_1]
MHHSSLSRPIHGGNLTWAAQLAGCSPACLLDFSANINPLGPPNSAIEAIHTHLPALRDYPDPDYGALRQALGQAHALSADWIFPGNGAAELLTWASRELAQLDCTYLIAPTFGDYRRALQAFSASVTTCPLEFSLSHQDSPVVEQLPLPASPRSSHCGVVLNSPHNPTGLLFSRKALIPYLEQFALVVVDEAFMDFLPPDEEQSLVAWVATHPNLVVLRSLTKFYSIPGLRLGYAVAHPDRLQRWQQWRDPWSVNSLAAAVGEVIVQDVEFQQQTWDWLAPARAQLLQPLAQISGLHPYPSSANFILVRSDESVIQLQERLLRHQQIFIRDCLSYPELGDRYFRIAVRTQLDNQRLLEGLKAR